MEALLRSATASDAASLGNLHVAAWHETYTGMLPDEMLAGLSVEARIAMWARILGDSAAGADAGVCVAEDNGRMVGFASCGRQRDDSLTGMGFDGEIMAIYVLRSHQGRGIGRRMMRGMAQALCRSHRTGVALWVLKENIAARRFYERLDGTVVGEKREERQNAVLMEAAYAWRDLASLIR